MAEFQEGIEVEQSSDSQVKILVQKQVAFESGFPDENQVKECAALFGHAVRWQLREIFPEQKSIPDKEPSLAAFTDQSTIDFKKVTDLATGEERLQATGRMVVDFRVQAELANNAAEIIAEMRSKILDIFEALAANYLTMAAGHHYSMQAEAARVNAADSVASPTPDASGNGTRS